MRQRSDFICLLLPLLDRDCLERLTYVPSNSLILFDDSRSKNRTFSIKDGRIEVDEVRFKEFKEVEDESIKGLGRSDDLNFSKSPNHQLKEYQLEKTSIPWKIRIKQKHQTIKAKENLNKESMIKNHTKDFITKATPIRKEDHRTAEIEKLVKDFINGIGKDLAKDGTVKDLTNDIGEDLPKERIDEIERFKNDHTKYESKIKELGKDFINRVMKVEELAKDPNKFKIEIKKNHLQIDKDLILLFGADGGFHFITNEEKYVIKILTILTINDDLVMLTEIGIFNFHLTNKDVISLNEKLKKNSF